MLSPYINIHTHRPTQSGVELVAHGIHPWRAQEALLVPFVDVDFAYQAVGEVGLDRSSAERCPSPEDDFAAQLTILRRELQRARQLDLPVVIHCVRAYEDIVRELHDCPPRATIFHGFIGSASLAKQLIDLGYYLSFGEQSFQSPKTLESLSIIPLDRLFFETDDSSVTIEDIYARGAAILGMMVKELLESTNQNYERIFKNV